MQLCNDLLELKVLRTLCLYANRMEISGKILSRCTEDSFYGDAANAAFCRVRAQVKSNGSIPTWDELTSDPVIPEKHRKDLLASEAKPLKNMRNLEGVLTNLEDYRKLRSLYFMYENGIDALSKESIDFTTLIDDNSENLAGLRTGSTDLSAALVHFGKGNNSVDLVKSRLNNETPRVVPTGFRAYDEKNGGFNYGSLVLIGATTGGGKTATAGIQLLKNMSMYEPACLISLEMSKEECTDRLLANLSGVKINKFSSGKLTEEDKTKVKKSYKRFVTEQKERDTRYSIWSPDTDITMEEALYGLLPFGYRVILVDYVGLLKGVDGDDQWKQLGKATRFAKVFAKTHNVIVIVLAQLSEEGKVRYAKAMQEHANNAWYWVYTEVSRETGILDIVQAKARNQDPTPFQLWHDFSVMRVSDVDAEHAAEHEQATSTNRRKVEKLAEDIDNYVLDMNDNEDDDE